ncbi:hypothetical protein DRN74_06000 [Candidatus Micrarchaeota archaeon]|nr:MAG: hypothetical protein DRN74_06000 [Candidatus Micrarchaeota archaeon]
MGNDISKKTVLVVLLIAIITSMICTWTLLDTISSTKIITPVSSRGLSGVGHGKVSIAIEQPPQPVSVSGMVAIEIAK